MLLIIRWDEESKRRPLKGVTFEKRVVGGNWVPIAEADILAHLLAGGSVYSNPTERIAESNVAPIKGIKPW